LSSPQSHEYPGEQTPIGIVARLPDRRPLARRCVQAWTDDREHLIGGGVERFDTNGLRFQKHSSDFFRASLGLGAGDFKATAAGERGATIEIPNVIFVDRHR
jgi:hypothetical protein